MAGALGALLVVGAVGLALWPRQPSGRDDWRASIAGWRHPDPLPELPLIDQDGRSFGLGDLRGSPVLVGFVFTRCGNASACPLTMRRLVDVQEAWGPADGPLGILVLTLDPAWDTPERLGAYARTHGLRTDGPVPAILATGDPELMSEGLPSLFNVLSLPGEGGLEHTVKLTLLDEDLRELASWKDGRFDVRALRHALTAAQAGR